MKRKRFVTALLFFVLPGSARAQDPSTPSSVTTPAYTLTRSFKPNPIRIKGITGMPNLSLERHFGTSYNMCRGYVSQKADVILNLPRGLPKARLVLKGGSVIHIRLPNGRYACNSHGYPRNTILMDNWPAGRLEVRVGTYHNMYSRTRPLGFTLTLEDLSRPRDLNWSKTIPTLSLAPLLVKPIIWTASTQAVAGSRLRYSSSSCSRYHFRHQPDFMIKVDQPITDIHYNLASHKDIMLLLLGPLTADRRNVPQTCMYQGHSTFRRLEPGIYGVKIGTRPNETSIPYTMVLRTRNTPLDPLEVVRNIPKRLSTWERNLYHFFPQLKKGQLYGNRALAQAIFAKAPKNLFVFPAFDFDKASASPLPSDYQHKEYPKKNEPMLVFGRGWVMGADGSAFRVQNTTYLRLRPDGPVAIPRSARNVFQTYGSAFANQGPEDAKAIKAYLNTIKRHRKCVDRVWRPFDRQINSIRSRRLTLWGLRRIRILKNRAESRAYNVCGTGRLAKMKTKLHKRLIETRTRRRNALLAKLRPHLTSLFQQTSAP